MSFSAVDQEADNDIKIVRTTSTFDCGGRCPVKLHVKNNTIIRVEGDDIENSDISLEAVFGVGLTENMFTTQSDLCIP